MRSCIPPDFGDVNENEKQYESEQIPKGFDYNPNITSYNQIISSEKVQNYIL